MLARKDTSKDIIALACKEKCPVDNPTTRIDQIVRALNSALLIGTAEHESEKSGDCVAMESALVISSGSNQLGLDIVEGIYPLRKSFGYYTSTSTCAALHWSESRMWSNEAPPRI